jgi:hypothetical protein
MIKKTQDGGFNYALSLGYKVKIRSRTGYTKDDIGRMTELVRHHMIEGKDPGTTSTLF